MTPEINVFQDTEELWEVGGNIMQCVNANQQNRFWEKKILYVIWNTFLIQNLKFLKNLKLGITDGLKCTKTTTPTEGTRKNKNCQKIN